MEETKIVAVRRFYGAMSYWSLAKTDSGWNTYQWLRRQAQRAGDFVSAEEFITRALCIGVDGQVG
jgi:hypothetical protein